MAVYLAVAGWGTSVASNNASSTRAAGRVALLTAMAEQGFPIDAAGLAGVAKADANAAV